MAESYSQLLDLNRAVVLGEALSGQTSDRIATFSWSNIPLNSLELAAQWEKAHRTSISNLKGEYKTFATGFWRSVSVEVKRSGQSGTIEHKFAYGYAQALTWTEARIVSGKRSSSNSQGVTGVDGTTSDNPGQHVIVRFPNLNPYKLSATLATAEATYTDPVVYTETLTGTWNVLFASMGKAEDGSGFIDLVLSIEKFTLKLFQYYNTVRQSSFYKLYNVPKPDAQTICDAWLSGGDGRSTDADYSDDGSLVTLVLRDRDSVKDNMSTGLIKNACDQWFQQHLAWGYTKEELAVWIQVHNGVVDEVDGDEGLDETPTTRTLQIQDRGDGLFNAIIEERTFVNTAPTAPGFTITLPTGTAITRQNDWGWNYNSTQVTASSIKNLYNETIKAAGVSVEFVVTRQDDCSFDYHAVITTQAQQIDSEIEMDSGTGVASKAISVRGASASELVTLANTLASECGLNKNVQVDINVRDDELSDVKASVRTVRATDDSIPVGDHTVYYGKNAEAILAADLSGVVIRSASVSPGDGGELDWAITVKPMYSGTFDKGSTPEHDYIQLGINQGSVPDPSGAVLRSASVQEGENGKWNYQISSESLDSGTFDKSATVAKNKRHVQIGDNRDTVPSPTGAVLISASVSEGDNGKWNYQLVSEDLEEVTANSIDEGSGVTETVTAGINSDSAPRLTSSRLVEDRASITPTPEGKVNWTRRVTTKATSSKTLVIGALGEAVTETTGFNVDPSAVNNPAQPLAKGQSITLSFIGFDDAGNMQYRLTNRQKSKVYATLYGGELAKKIEMTAATGDVGTLPSTVATKGISYDIDLRVDDTGAVTWRNTKITTSPQTTGLFTLAKLKPGWAEGGYTETANVFKYNTTLPTFGEYGRFEELTIHDNGTYSGRIVTIIYDEQTFFEGFTVNGAAYQASDIAYTWRRGDSSTTAVTYKQHCYQILYHQVTEGFHDNYADAQGAIIGGMLNGSGVTLASIGGKRFWHSVRVDPAISASNWSDLGNEILA